MTDTPPDWVLIEYIGRLPARWEPEMHGLMERGVTGGNHCRVWVDLAPTDAVKHGLRRIEWQR